MERLQARRIIESLRKGIPPEGFVRQFTVGRQDEKDDLDRLLHASDGTVQLLKANYGAGKTHLLRYIREAALASNFAVSSVTVEAQSGVRFNRMDQIFGAVCRNIEVPQAIGERGLKPFFQLIVDNMNNEAHEKKWQAISNNWKWDYSEELDSQAVFVAVRAWAKGNTNVRDTVEDWLRFPWNYKSQRKTLYLELIEGLRQHFRDPRPEWKFYADGVFIFQTGDYEQSWSALRDFNSLAKASGLNGLILLFDEFEDVITNMKNVAHQESAFWNLFDFYGGKRFPGKSFYGVTPEFVVKYKRVLAEKGKWDQDFSRFDDLPTYEMTPLKPGELQRLSVRILDEHEVAYGWQADRNVVVPYLQAVVQKAGALQAQDLTRHVIVAVVRALDDLLESQ